MQTLNVTEAGAEGFDIPPHASTPPAPPNAGAAVHGNFHVPNPRVEGLDDEPAPAKLPAVPKDLKAALALLKQCQAMPLRNPAEKRKRAAHLAFAQRHFARLQELPVPKIDHGEMSECVAAQRRTLPMQRLVILARSNPDVSALLKAHDELVAEVQKLRANV